MPTNPLRSLPSVSELLESPQLKALINKVNQNVVVSRVKSVLDDLRTEVQSAAAEMHVPSLSEVAEMIARRILAGDEPKMRPVINATGILLPPGLGRSPLAEDAIAEIVAVARDYSSVDLDLTTGQRSPRDRAVAGRLQQLTGCEASLVVNNGAAATLLVLAGLAAGREVIVSRGELIEMGEGYRLPDVIAASGAKLREVGTTNRTRLADYRDAVGAETAAIVQIHTGNYRIVGSSSQVTLEELSGLGRERRLPVIHVLGSGALVDFGPLGCPEPLVSESIAKGADLVLFCGDKLVGGPQCGIVVGRRSWIEQIGAMPLARALRADKLTLAALAATLRLYREPAQALRSIPLLQLLSTSPENLKNRAQRLTPQLVACPAIQAAEAIEESTFLGGASLPGEQIPTWCISLTPAKMTVEDLATALRTGRWAVLARVRKDRLLLDLRSVFPRQDQALVEAVMAVEERK